MRTIWGPLTTLSANDLVALVNSCDLVSMLRSALGQPGDHVRARGALQVGDGGGGDFIWNAASTAADDGVFTIEPTEAPYSGRWIRVLDSNEYSAAWWGIDATGTSPADAAVHAADIAAAASGVSLAFGPGTVLLNSSYAFTAPVRLANGALLRPASGVTLTLLNTPKVASSVRVFDLTQGGSVTIATPTDPVIPTWWGTDGHAKIVSANVAIGLASNQLVSTAAIWTQADIGKTIVVPAAGNPAAANTELQTTISAVSTDGKTATLAANAGAAVSNASATTLCFGFDDTAAIGAAMIASATGKPIAVSFVSGSYIIDAAQPTFATAHMAIAALGRARIIRLDPASPNGLPAWNFSGTVVIIEGMDFVTPAGVALPPIVTARLNPAEPRPSSIVSASFQMTPASFRYFCDPTARAMTGTLPASPNKDDRYFVKDYTGAAGTNAIGLNGNGKLIDGQATIAALIQEAFGWAEVQFNGTSWSIVG